jgi:hypothetical protein
MNREDAFAFCGKWLEAWSGNKPEHLIGFYSNDASYVDPANKERLRGHEQILSYFRKLLAANPNWIWRAIEVFPTEVGFILKWEATIPVGTEAITEFGMDIVEVDHGRIARNEVFFDRSSLIGALRKVKEG